jgi:hypothetical protein
MLQDSNGAFIRHELFSCHIICIFKRLSSVGELHTIAFDTRSLLEQGSLCFLQGVCQKLVSWKSFACQLVGVAKGFISLEYFPGRKKIVLAYAAQKHTNLPAQGHKLFSLVSPHFQMYFRVNI